jgi:hypothetical protein
MCWPVYPTPEWKHAAFRHIPVAGERQIELCPRLAATTGGFDPPTTGVVRMSLAHRYSGADEVHAPHGRDDTAAREG